MKTAVRSVGYCECNAETLHEFRVERDGVFAHEVVRSVDYGRLSERDEREKLWNRLEKRLDAALKGESER